MPFTVRQATRADAPTIADFNSRLASETEHLTLEPATIAAGVAAVLADPNRGRYFVADEAGAVIGQIMITFEWSDWRNGWIWWLQSVYVRADRRRHGIFRSLLDHIVAAAIRENVAAIRLYVEKENRSAQATYKGLGFEEMHFYLMGRTIAREPNPADLS
jgi:ribosomal protein S18 acetylase RimI-like enzyme